jgi:hypothetical protein
MKATASYLANQIKWYNLPSQISSPAAPRRVYNHHLDDFGALRLHAAFIHRSYLTITEYGIIGE